MSNLRTSTISGSINKSTGISNPRKETKVRYTDPTTKNATLLSRFGGRMYSYSTNEVTVGTGQSKSVSVSSLPGSSTVRTA